jgi:hypothetical protein
MGFKLGFIWAAIGLLFFNFLSAQTLPFNRIEVSGNYDYHWAAKTIHQGRIFVSPYDDKISSPSKIYKISNTGVILDSMVAISGDGNLRFAFSRVFGHDANIYWIGYAFFTNNPLPRADGDGLAIFVTDTNLNFVDYFFEATSGAYFHNYVIIDNRFIVQSFSELRTFVAKLGLYEFEFGQPLAPIRDTVYDPTSIMINGMIPVKNNAIAIFFRHGGYHEVQLSDFSIEMNKPLVPTGNSFVDYRTMSSMLMEDSSIVSFTSLGPRIMWHNLDLILLDTLQLPTPTTGGYIGFFDDCDAVIGVDYFFGGTLPWINSLDLTLPTSIKISKVNRGGWVWDAFIQEDSVHKTLVGLLPDADQHRLYAVYLNHDLRTARMKRSVVITVLDTSGSVLSTQTLWEAPKSAISLYPNPAGEWFVIDTDSRRPVDLTIHHANGQVVRTQQQVQPGTRVPIADLAKGTYMVSIALHGSAEPPVVRRLVVR